MQKFVEKTAGCLRAFARYLPGGPPLAYAAVAALSAVGVTALLAPERRSPDVSFAASPATVNPSRRASVAPAEPAPFDDEALAADLSPAPVNSTLFSQLFTALPGERGDEALIPADVQVALPRAAALSFRSLPDASAVTTARASVARIGLSYGNVARLSLYHSNSPAGGLLRQPGASTTSLDSIISLANTINPSSAIILSRRTTLTGGGGENIVGGGANFPGGGVVPVRTVPGSVGAGQGAGAPISLAVGAGDTLNTAADAAHTGTLSLGDATWSGGGAYLWKVSDATSAAQWDEVDMTSLSVNATASAPFVIKMQSLGVTAGSSAPANFDPAVSYQWTIGRIAGVVTVNGTVPTASDAVLAATNGHGSVSDLFALDTSGFAATDSTGAASSGYFQLDLQRAGAGNNLVLSYSAAPEAATPVLALAGILPVLLIRWRKPGTFGPLRGAWH